MTLPRKIVHAAVRFFYPILEITEQERIPHEGPVLFVANHANSLIDPVVIGIAAERPVHFLAKAPLFDIPVFGQLMRAVGMLPAYRGSDDPSQVGGNLESLAHAGKYLVEGRCVGIFPEGKSHDALKVDRVKSGASRIAVQAVLQGATDFRIVPLGINYERKEKFRSSIWVRVGRPIELKEWKERIVSEEKVAQRQLTNEIDLRLKEVVIHLNEDIWEPFVPDLEVLVPPPAPVRKPDAPQDAPRDQKLSSIGALQQRKRIADAMNHFLQEDRPRAEAIAREIQAHRETLNNAGLTIQSDLFRLRYTRLFLRQTWDFIWLILGFLPAFLGTLHNIVPYVLLRLIALALPKSNRSVIALTKLGLGIPIYGAWYAFAWWSLSNYFVPQAATVWSGLMVFAGLFALKYWPRGIRALGLWFSELRMLLQQEKLRQLRKRQFELRHQLETLAEEYRRAHVRAEPQKIVTIWTPKLLARVAGWIVLFGVSAVLIIWGFSLWEQKQTSILQRGGLELSKLPAEQLGNLLKEDEKALLELLHGLRDLETKARAVQTELTSGQRAFYSQQDNDAIRQLMFSYVTYRTELLRLIWKYQNYEQVADETLKLRTFLLELTAGAALYETSFKFVTQFAQSPEAIRKLNEGEPVWEIPPGLFDLVRANLAAPRNRELMEGAMTAYRRYAPAFARAGLIEPMPYSVFHEIIAQSQKTTADLDKLAAQWIASRPIEDIARDAKQALYRGQSLISTWVGDTRIRQPRDGKPLIQPAQLRELGTMLQPGDILLERQNWYLSRAFMPGYWAHAAFYVGTTNDLARMGLQDDPRIQKFWKQFAARDASGHEYVILEAVPRGVRMTTLEHCVGIADSAAVLRPDIPKEMLPEAIAQAFVHLGKPYDFEFDFFSTDKLVCTELVYRCCDKQVDFPLVEVMGRKTLPPTELVRKFATEFGKPTAQLKFVAFLDGEESKDTARFRDARALAETINRPSLTWLQEQQ